MTKIEGLTITFEACTYWPEEPQPKIPYTDDGVQQLRDAIERVESDNPDQMEERARMAAEMTPEDWDDFASVAIREVRPSDSVVGDD